MLTSRMTDHRRSEALFLLARADRSVQALCGHQGTIIFATVDALLIPFKRAQDPEYAAMMDAQPKPKGRGRKKTMLVHFSLT